MTESPLRRLVAVGLAYVLGGWVVLLFGGWLQRLLALPPLFERLLAWGVGLGFFLAMAMAWAYPALGTHGRPVDGEGARPREP